MGYTDPSAPSVPLKGVQSDVDLIGSDSDQDVAARKRKSTAMPKIQAKKPASRVVPPEVVVVAIAEEYDLDERENISRLRKMNDWDNENLEFPTVSCNQYGCSYQETWKRMECNKVYLSWEEKKGDKEEFLWYRLCWMCVGRRECLLNEDGVPDEGKCRAFIREHKPDFVRKQKEMDVYKMAKTHVQKIFPMMSLRQKGKAIKVFEGQESFTAIFAPFAEYILIKNLQLSEEDKKNNKALALMDDLRQCKDASKVLDLLDRVEMLTCETPLLAFKDDPDQHRKWFATTYSDEWCGVLGGWFRSYYICLYNCVWEAGRPKMCPGCCGTLIPSKLWNLKIEDDPLADAQRWYCWQNHKHNATWGQVIEMMTLTKKLLYIWAKVPAGSIQDIRALKIEEEMGPSVTAEQIYDMLLVIPPQKTSFITIHPDAPKCPPGKERFFYMDEETFNQLEEFQWYQIFNMTGAPMTEHVKTGAKAKAKMEQGVAAKKAEIDARMKSRAAASSSSGAK